MSREKTPLGKRRVVFKMKEAHHDLAITVPCGKCIGCFLERARQWSVRVVHEASLWPVNSFVTLTYDNESLPRCWPGGPPTLQVRDVQLFMKRLRKARTGDRVRFFQAGEYGRLGRPHYHAVLFNCDFPDKQACGSGPGGHTLYRSEELASLWPQGFSTIGAVTKESSSYVARYAVKKVRELSPEAGAAASGANRGKYRGDGSEKEFLTMSRRPGIGALWFEKFYRDIYPADKMVLSGGTVVRPPRYYDELYGRIDGKKLRQLKKRRVAAVVRSEQSSGRLIAKQHVAERRVQDFLKREIE